MRARPLAVLLSLFLAATATGQATAVDRYELGLRLRALERAIDASTDEKARALAFAQLERAVQAFFGLDFAGVAGAVGRAHAALRGEPPSAASTFAARAVLFAERRLVDPDAGTAALELREVSLRPARREADEDGEDEPLAGPPDDCELVVRSPNGDRELLRAKVAERPQTLALPLAGLAEGDLALPWRLVRGDAVLVERELHLSLAKGCDRRLEALGLARERDDLEGRTLAALVRQLTGMTRARREETVLPGERLLRDAEAIAALAADATYYDDARSGQHWLVVPTDAGAATVRVAVPETKATGERPVVIALHGAGGSENLFCDGYGDGAVVRLCATRGWLLCAPRSGGMTGVDVPALLDALDDRYAIDRRRVFLVGHSMGAMQAVGQACRSPRTFRAVAALGGGGSVRRSADLAKLPFLVGAGERDFGRSGAKALHEALKRAGVRAEYREYPDVEHLSIVQISLPDVFQFFDAEAAGPRDAR